MDNLKEIFLQTAVNHDLQEDMANKYFNEFLKLLENLKNNFSLNFQDSNQNLLYLIDLFFDFLINKKRVPIDRDLIVDIINDIVYPNLIDDLYFAFFKEYTAPDIINAVKRVVYKFPELLTENKVKFYDKIIDELKALKVTAKDIISTVPPKYRKQFFEKVNEVLEDVSLDFLPVDPEADLYQIIEESKIQEKKEGGTIEEKIDDKKFNKELEQKLDEYKELIEGEKNKISTDAPVSEVYGYGSKEEDERTLGEVIPGEHDIQEEDVKIKELMQGLNEIFDKYEIPENIREKFVLFMREDIPNKYLHKTYRDLKYDLTGLLGPNKTNEFLNEIKEYLI